MRVVEGHAMGEGTVLSWFGLHSYHPAVRLGGTQTPSLPGCPARSPQHGDAVLTAGVRCARSLGG